MPYNAFKNSLTEFKNEYLNTKLKRFEFISCLLFIVLVLILQTFNNASIQALLSQIQRFVLVYMAFRFGIVGISISIIATLKDICIILYTYISTPDTFYIIGLTSSITVIIWSLVIGTISKNQQDNKKESQQIAITDDLTTAYNKRYFNTTLNQDISSKNNSTIGLLIIDIDNFRMYNDLYGRKFGDTILKNTANILKDIVKNECSVYRFGGDEFGLLVKNHDLDSLEQFAQKIYSEYEKNKKTYYTNESFNENLVKKITFSIGFSVYPEISKSAEELVSHANTALYQTKNNHEDKINFYQDIMIRMKTNVLSDQQMLGVFRGLLSTINTKDSYSFNHCERVSAYAVMVGEAMELDINEIQTLLYAGLLYDIGKIELSMSLLNKIDPLTNEEINLIHQHPIHSASILSPLSGMKNLIDYVRQHHERYDGFGYPYGIKGEEISLGARIICIVDSFDAMVSNRPYHKAISIEDAFLELEKCSGTQFDPHIVSIFIKTMINKMSINYSYKYPNTVIKQVC